MSRLPLAWLGVPTQTKDNSVWRIASSWLSVARSRPNLTVRFDNFAHYLASMMGDWPAFMSSTFVRTGSTFFDDLIDHLAPGTQQTPFHST